MKKTLLFAGVALAFATQSKAQVVFSDDFNDGLIAPWTVIDADGDGRNWNVVQIQDNQVPPQPVGTPVLRSASWQTIALTPNNYVFSPAIDLTGFFPGSATAELSWKVMAIDASWDAERYTAYVGTAPDVATMLASPTSHYEASLNGVNTLTERTLDISEWLGQTIYIAFRHHGVSDQFTMEIDDVAVEVTPELGTANFFASNFQVYPNPASDVLNINGRNNMNLSSVQLTDLNGRVVKTQNVAGVSSQLNISDLNAGVYLLKVTSPQGVGTTKVIKR